MKHLASEAASRQHIVGLQCLCLSVSRETVGEWLPADNARIVFSLKTPFILQAVFGIAETNMTAFLGADGLPSHCQATKG